MSRSFFFSRWLIDFIGAVSPGDSKWHKNKLNQIGALQKQNLIKEIEIEHEIELLKIKFSEELNRAKEKELRITHDYKEFLDNIDEMKLHIVETFPDMPKALALLIHQHAKQLIDDMWNHPNEQEQTVYRAKLAQFLKVVFDDTTEVITENEKPKIPKRTLELIR